MALYRLISQTLVQQFPGYIVVDGVVHTNADAEAIAVQGGEWHPLVISPVPQFDEQTQHLEKEYTLDDGYIRLDWVVRNTVPGGDAEF